jgi:hypothetical protein
MRNLNKLFYFTISYDFQLTEKATKITTLCERKRNSFYIKQDLTTPKRPIFCALFGVFLFVKFLKMYYDGNN